MQNYAKSLGNQHQDEISRYRRIGGRFSGGLITKRGLEMGGAVGERDDVSELGQRGYCGVNMGLIETCSTEEPIWSHHVLFSRI